MPAVLLDKLGIAIDIDLFDQQIGPLAAFIRLDERLNRLLNDLLRDLAQLAFILRVEQKMIAIRHRGPLCRFNYVHFVN